MPIKVMSGAKLLACFQDYSGLMCLKGAKKTSKPLKQKDTGNIGRFKKFEKRELKKKKNGEEWNTFLLSTVSEGFL